ncbi:Pr6Pr family membrane protein [Curtobacterium aetherium]|uniref:Pr6Pr family membrane protein n=1 Tax=Curtobacterium aetherium TaxID=2841594 RepID=A0ACD1E572_9MICO|nr:Pr6Pr family membrane protein [Curtobacterium sp. L6-1]QWS34078.1 Pr6Pr family membrane protein [Curtobacterium sp. L6-1]
MRIFVNTLRLVVAVVIVAAVVTDLQGALRNDFVFWNFFGYFTNQSNLLVAAVLTLTVVAAIGDRPSGRRLDLFRGAATVYIATTGLVYNTLLADVGQAVGESWSNDVVHRWVPLYVVLDWVLFSDRSRLFFRDVWWFLVYPAVWLVVVVVRGATDGWVPYPFLDPVSGYGIVALYCLGVAVFIGLMGIVVVALSRLRLVPVSGRRAGGRARGRRVRSAR